MTFNNVIAASVRRLCSPEAFIVRMELASRGLKGGAECRPSQGTLARDALLSRNTVRRVLDELAAAGEIVKCGKYELGIGVWHIRFLDDPVPPYIHGRMVLRAFQHRLKPLPRALLISIAARADKEGRTNGRCPSSADLQRWFQISVNTVGRGLRTLVEAGLLKRTQRAGGRTFDAAQYDVTFGETAAAWEPGVVTKNRIAAATWSPNLHRGGHRICTGVVTKSEHNHCPSITDHYPQMARLARARAANGDQFNRASDSAQSDYEDNGTSNNAQMRVPSSLPMPVRAANDDAPDIEEADYSAEAARQIEALGFNPELLHLQALQRRYRGICRTAA